MQQQSLRITPSILEFHDFVDGTCVSKTVSVQNISPRRLKVAMEAPKSLFFSIVDLHKKTDVVLAPGISVDITVEFRFNKPKNNNAVSVTGVQDGERDYPTEITDYVRFTAGKSDETMLQLSALPAVPKICVDSVIDFGTILLPSRSSSQDSSINASPKVFTKYIKIRNEGLVPTTLQVVLDDSPSIQVTPMTLSLPAAKRSEAYETLKVDFRPSSAGVFNGKILLAINQSAASKSHQNPAAVINICAEVLDKQLHLRQSGSSKEIDDCNIDFGALYRGESSKFFVNVVNNGPAALRWKFLDGDGSEIRPDGPSSVFCIHPSSGILPPHAKCDVELEMRTKRLEKTVGFKNERAIDKPEDVKKSFILQMVEPYSLLAAKDMPIKFSLSGSICPVEVLLDTRSFNFGVVHVKDSKKTSVNITNSSERLPVIFKTKKCAHFKMTPEEACVPQGKTIPVEITFHPNQIGNFETLVEFDIYCPRPNVPQEDKGKVITIIDTLQLELHGSACVSTNLVPVTYEKVRPASIFARGPASMRKEREQLEIHRKKYDSIITNHRIERFEKEKYRMLGSHFEEEVNEIADMKRQTKEIIEDWSWIDPVTGLPVPQPELSLINSTDDSGKSIKKAQIHSGNIGELSTRQRLSEQDKMLRLFDALLATEKMTWNGNVIGLTVDCYGDLQKVKTEAFQKQHSNTASSPLSPVDLANIFALHQKLDFGDIYNHSEKSITFSLLNCTPSKTPILVTLSLENEDNKSIREEAKITPNTLVLAPMSIGMFNVSIQSHLKPSAFTQNSPRAMTKMLTYRINNQYEYQIPVTGSIKPTSVCIKGEHEISGHLKLRAVAQQDPSTQAVIFPRCQKSLEIRNSGGHPVLIECSTGRAQNTNDGHFIVSPSTLRIGAFSTGQISITFIGGLLANCPDTLSVKVYDAYYTTAANDGTITVDQQLLTSECLSQTHQISLIGEMGETKLAFAGSHSNSKKIPIVDFGCVPRSSEAFSRACKTQAPKRHKDYPIKTIKIRNIGKNQAFFTVALGPTTRGEVSFEPQSGILDAEGGSLDLNVWVVPSQATQKAAREDLIVSFYGSGKAVTIPINYHCKMAKFSYLMNTADWDLNAFVGSEKRAEIRLKNESDINGKICINLSDYKEFDLISEKTRVLLEPTDVPGDKKYKDYPAVVLRKPRLEEEQHWIVSDRTQQQHSNRLNVLEISPGQMATLNLIFKPLKEGSHTFNLPILSDSVKANHAIVVKALASISPLNVSRSCLQFKNKTIFPKQVGIMRPSVVIQELITLENVSSQKISWWINSSNNNVLPEKQQSVAFETIVNNGNVGSISPSKTATPLTKPISDVFSVDICSGEILPRQSVQITVKFNPTHVGNYSTSVPLFADVFSSSKPLMMLEFSGLGLEPCLSIQPPELFLPVLPLGEEITIPISVKNFGFDKTEIDYTISEDLLLLLAHTEADQRPEIETVRKIIRKLPLGMDNADEKTGGRALGGGANNSSATAAVTTTSPHIEILFPEGRILKGENESLPLLIKFRAPANEHVSFSSFIQFHIEMVKSSVSGDVKIRKNYFLPIHGIADNSLLSVWPYLYSNTPFFQRKVHPKNDAVHFDVEQYTGNGKMQDETMAKRKLFFAEKFIFRSPGGVPLDSDSKDSIYEHLVSMLRKWIIEPFGLQRMFYEEFPNDFVQLHGKPLHDIVFTLTEKKEVVPALPVLDLHDPEIRREQLLAYYSELLNSLKSLGAVLNFVKPEFLLSAEDFHAWWKSGIRKSLAEGKLTAAELQKEEYYTRMDMYFKYVSTESWAHLIMQAAKLFVFDRISPKQVKNTSGFQLKEDDQLLSGIAKSSVYSVPESLLLHWATMGYHRSTGVWRPVKNFEKDLADGSVIYHIIKAYIGDGQMPQCTKLLNFNGDKHSDSETNTKILMQALSEIFASQTSDPLPVYSNERVGQIDFSRVKLGDLYDMAFLLCFLYQTLPQFLPKFKIEFTGALHEKCSRTIEISNLSHKPIAYALQLTGTKCFALKSKSSNADDQTKDSAARCKSVSLAPKSTCSLTVDFSFHFLKSQKGLLILKSKAMAINNSSILTYQLLPVMEAAVPTKIFQLELSLYQSSPEFVLQMDVENIFQRDGNFSITLTESRKSGLQLSKKAGAEGSNRQVSTAMASRRRLSVDSETDGGPQAAAKREKSIVENKETIAIDDNNKADFNPPTFYLLEQKKLSVAAGASVKIPIAIIPFDRNEMECLIHFHDPEVGEFLYRIDLTVALPTATETLTFRTSPNVPAQRNLCVDLGSRIREKAVIQALEHSVRIAKQMSADHPVSIEDSELKRYRPPVSDSLKYSIQYESPYWTGPSEIRVNSEHGKKWMPAGYSNVEQSNADTVILFKAKEKGTYKGRMVLNCVDFPDTRVIELVGHVQEKSSSSIEIHIDSFANKEVVQEIPIPNKTSQDWLVKVNFEPALSSITSHSSMVVKANQSAYLPLCIRPRTEEIGRTLMTSLVLECPGYFQQRFSIQVKVDQ